MLLDSFEQAQGAQRIDFGGVLGVHKGDRDVGLSCKMVDLIWIEAAYQEAKEPCIYHISIVEL
jgi:hypothetical protein